MKSLRIPILTLTALTACLLAAASAFAQDEFNLPGTGAPPTDEESIKKLGQKWEEEEKEKQARAEAAKNPGHQEVGDDLNSLKGKIDRLMSNKGKPTKRVQDAADYTERLSDYRSKYEWLLEDYFIVDPKTSADIVKQANQLRDNIASLERKIAKADGISFDEHVRLSDQITKNMVAAAKLRGKVLKLKQDREQQLEPIRVMLRLAESRVGEIERDASKLNGDAQRALHMAELAVLRRRQQDLKLLDQHDINAVRNKTGGKLGYDFAREARKLFQEIDRDGALNLLEDLPRVVIPVKRAPKPTLPQPQKLGETPGSKPTPTPGKKPSQTTPAPGGLSLDDLPKLPGRWVPSSDKPTKPPEVPE